jgi:hypothetical protein
MQYGGYVPKIRRNLLFLLEVEVAGFSETSVETFRLQPLTTQKTNLHTRFDGYTPVRMKATIFGKVM